MDKNNKNQRFFIKEKFIKQRQEGVLTVAVNLEVPATIKVYWDDDDVINLCDENSSHPECEADNMSDVTLLEVGVGGAVFGNDQDDLGEDFKKNQAFEGKFYGLTVYNKMLHPDELASSADKLVYVITPSNIPRSTNH